MNEFADVAKTGGNKVTIFGVIAIILGILAMLAPVLTGMWVVILVGVLVLIVGIVRIAWAFQAGSLGKGVVMFAIGGLTLLCGIVLLAHPLFASGVLTVLLALYFILDGISEIVASVRLRPGSGWGWMLFGGIVSLWLGIIIWRQFPLSGVWAIGILLGIKLFFVGLIMLMGRSTVRPMAKV
jgi:uncharacterized membrane protein HdeD (DUF308 family)